MRDCCIHDTGTVLKISLYFRQEFSEGQLHRKSGLHVLWYSSPWSVADRCPFPGNNSSNGANNGAANMDISTNNDSNGSSNSASGSEGRGGGQEDSSNKDGGRRDRDRANRDNRDRDRDRDRQRGGRGRDRDRDRDRFVRDIFAFIDRCNLY